MNYQLFIDKYQPLYFKDFEIEEETITLLNTFIEMDSLNNNVKLFNS